MNNLLPILYVPVALLVVFIIALSVHKNSLHHKRVSTSKKQGVRKLFVVKEFGYFCLILVILVSVLLFVMSHSYIG